ncbi:MAG: DUF4625 domain-containing protein [Bacteroidota bacterium]
MKRNFLLYLSIISTLLVASCSSDDDSLDNQRPEINVISPNEAQAFESGESIPVDIDFTDNEALVSYKIEIHYAGDGHEHRSDFKDDHLEEWAYEVTGALSGNTDNVEIQIDIPTEVVEGDYHFGVIALDEAGNQAEAFTDIEIGDHHDHDDDDHGDRS